MPDDVIEALRDFFKECDEGDYMDVEVAIDNLRSATEDYIKEDK